MLFSSHFCVLLFVSSTCFASVVVGSPPQSVFITKLVYYQSIDSPMFNPNLTLKERSLIDLKLSMRRASYIAHTSRSTDESPVGTYVYASSAGFAAYMQVGSQLTPQYLLMDTGSAFTWINCSPNRKEHSAPHPLFVPKESETFEKEYCNSTVVCQPNSFIISCEGGAGCDYYIKYGTGRSTGYLGRDRVKFGRSYVGDVVFGCSEFNDIGFGTNNGILGLGYRNLAILKQLNSTRFAYCLSDISDTSDISSKFLFGSGVELLGQSTRMFFSGRYSVSIEGIKVGDYKLRFDPRILRRDPEVPSSGTILDTGSTFTFFPKLVVKEFLDEIEFQLDLLRISGGYHNFNGYNLNCYYGTIYRDLESFPDVELIFEDSATMRLTPANLFRQMDLSTFCLAIVPSEYMGLIS